MDSISRRQALSIAAVGSVAGLAGVTRGASASTQLEPLGWDEASSQYSLPALPYAYDALEPAIDAQTMRLHHDKHHAGYVKGLNKALKEIQKIRAGESDATLTKHWMRQLAFHGCGHVNHTLFWQSMTPTAQGGGGEPDGALAHAIHASFGSFKAFEDEFFAAAASVEGSGWAWLVHEPVSRRLLVVQMEKHQNQAFAGTQPLMGIDVWEHAYYLKYQNQRKAYIKAFSNIINWNGVGKRYEALINQP